MFFTDEEEMLDLPDEQINKKRRKEGEKKRKRKETTYVYIHTYIRINLLLECSLTAGFLHFVQSAALNNK